MANREKLRLAAIRLAAEGENVLYTADSDSDFPDVLYPKPKEVGKWMAGCRNLMRLLGELATPWKEAFDGEMSHGRVRIGIGTLEAIREAIDDDLLIRVEELVSAEIFESLLEQAEYLLSEDYHLAAGVLGRAVLEEHLRKWCELENCEPTESKPTLQHFKTELYKADHLTKVEMRHVEWLIDIGNNAAHNLPEFKPEDVEKMIPEVCSFLATHPLS